MIKLNKISKTFDQNKIIDDLDLEVNQGERIAIIGPSGCGKSTLLRLMIGLQRPDSGEIFVADQDINKLNFFDLQKLRLKFGMLFQSGALFDSLTIFENVAFSLVENLHLTRAEIKKIVAQKLELVDLGGTEDLMPSDLSGGMKKRAALARAIACNPEIMLYDEPTTGLDPIRSTHIENLIVKLAKTMNMTSVIVTHQHSTIFRAADKIYFMHEGKLFPPETPFSIRNSTNPIINSFIKGET